jgi:large subunit ribosomal protein L6
MSRLGKEPVPVPEKTHVSIEGSRVTAVGPVGQIVKDLPEGIRAEVKESVLRVTRSNNGTRQKSLHGTWRKVLSNMVEGVSKGFSKELRIEGVGFRALSAGSKLTLTLGYSHPIDYTVPAGIRVVVDQKQTGRVVQGADKEKVGQVAAEIRDFKRPEPYKGTGVRYINEQVRRKAGKAAAGAAGGAAGGAKK